MAAIASIPCAVTLETSMKRTLVALSSTQVAYYLMGVLRDGWNLYFFQESPPELRIAIVVIGGVFQGALAVFVFGLVSKWISESFERRETPILKERWICFSSITLLVATAHLLSLQGDSRPLLEFFSVLLFLGPVPFILKWGDPPEVDPSDSSKSWWSGPGISNK